MQPVALDISPSWVSSFGLGGSVAPVRTAPISAILAVPLADRKDVLARHGKLQRFAVHLAHRQFVLGPGEILIERPDPDGRTQHVSVGTLADEPDARPTTWIFDKGHALHLSEAVYCVCVSDPNQTDGCVRHGKTSSPGAAQQRGDAARERRISREEARYRRGFPVAGHGEPERAR
jgi:hypothetical protein